MGFKRTRALVAIGAVAVGAALLGACAPAPVAPETTTTTTVPAPPKYLFEFNRTNEPTVEIGFSNGITFGVPSGQLGIAATTSVSGTVRVDCTGLSGSDVRIDLRVRRGASAEDSTNNFFFGACNSEIPVSVPSTAFVATDSFMVVAGVGSGAFIGLPLPAGTVTTFAIHSDALVPGTISL